MLEFEKPEETINKTEFEKPKKTINKTKFEAKKKQKALKFDTPSVHELHTKNKVLNSN